MRSVIAIVQPIVFRGRMSAAAGDGYFYLAPHLEALEPDHPDRLFVSMMCFYARDVLTGQTPGPYRDDRAEMAARSTLMNDGDFARAAFLGDADIAEMFGVPLDQVVAKRADLGRPERVRPAHPA